MNHQSTLAPSYPITTLPPAPPSKHSTSPHGTTPFNNSRVNEDGDVTGNANGTFRKKRNTYPHMRDTEYPRPRNSCRNILVRSTKSLRLVQMRPNPCKRDVMMPSFARSEMKQEGCGYFRASMRDNGGCSRLSYILVYQHPSNATYVSRKETFSQLSCSPERRRKSG